MTPAVVYACVVVGWVLIIVFFCLIEAIAEFRERRASCNRKRPG